MDPFELEEESIDIFRFAPHVRGTQGEWHDKIQNTDLTKYKLYKNTTVNMSFKNLYFDLNLPWLNSRDQRQDLNLSIYFYDVFM